MKKILILLLLFTLSCKNTSSTGGESTGETETTTQPVVDSPTPPETPVTPPETPVTPPETPVTPPETPVTPPVTDPIPTTPETPIVNQTWTEEFMDLVNEHRRSIGLRDLIHHDELGAIAIEHSQNMANGTVSFGHTGFSTRCSEGRSALGGGNWCGENVAAGQKTPQDAFNSWMNSSGHRANIESSKATHSGFGYAKSSSGKYYWTQIFIQH